MCAKFFAIFWLATLYFSNFRPSSGERIYCRCGQPRLYCSHGGCWIASCLALATWSIAPSVAVCLALSVGFFFFIPASELRGCGKTLSLVEILKWPAEEFAR